MPTPPKEHVTAAATFEQIVDTNKDLLLKPLKSAVLVAPMSVDVPIKFTTGTDAKFQSLYGYSSLGLMDKGGGPQFRPNSNSRRPKAGAGSS
ncbi:hypothetical protein [Nocardia brasiliensis]|uniref:hypothetical protein n=1 Tax=Nocardia brasiliensis TaxID=37326 RepID=UPI00366D1674